jgi:hypothetical protein
MKPTEYVIGPTHYYMFGDYVAVVIPKESYEPYIDFVWVQKEDDGEVWIDEDKTTNGGLSTHAAITVAKELLDAARWLKKRVYNNE